jgi:foldase protein PrsA
VRRFLWIQIRTIPLIILFFLFLFCPIHLGYGSSPKAEKDSSEDKLLAKINKEPLTLKRFHDYLQDRHILSSNDLKEDQKKKEEALHELIRDILIDQKAFAMDMDSDSGFAEEKKKHMNDFLLENLHNKEVMEKVQIPDQEIKDYYKQHKEQYYTIPEKRQIRQLLIRIDVDPTQKNYKKNLKKADKEAKKKIEALYQRAKAGEDLSELARQYSEDIGRLDLTGNIGYVEKGKLSPPLDSVAFALKVGEISPPVKDETGYYLISVLDIKPKEYREFDEKVERGIRGLLEEGRIKKKTQEYMEQLDARTKFVYHEDILNQPDSLVQPDDWALIINDRDTITFGYYASKISWYKENVGKDSLTLEDKKDLLANFLAMPIILVREAEKLGYRDSMDYKVEERAFTLEEAKKKLKLEKLKKDFPPPTREEAEAYYQAHKIDYPSLGVPIHVYHILFEDSLKAVEVLNQIRNGADFVELAKQYYPGEPEIKDVAYDLGFITQDEMPQNFYQKALSLNVGEVSEPVRTQWGFHLIKVVEKEKEGKTFEDILPKIEEDMKWKKIDEYQKEWEKSLFDEVNIWIDKKLLKEFQLDKPQG